MPQMTAEQMQQFQQMMMGGGGGPSGPGGPAGSSMRAPLSSQTNPQAKKWITLYPIYFDAKRSHKDGERRVSWAKSSLCPHSLGLVKAVSKLDLVFSHEPTKTHPRDWENPGRVKVKLFDEGGNALNSKFSNRKKLLEAVAPLMQTYCGGAPPVSLPKREKQQTAIKKRQERATKAATGANKAGVDQKAAAGAAATSGKKGAAAGSKTMTDAQAKATSAAAPPRVSKLTPGSSARASAVARRKLLQSHMPSATVRLPPHSPSMAAGLLNMGGGGEGGMPGGGGGGSGNPMEALGGMMGNLGFGQEDDEGGDGDEEGGAEEDKKKQHDPFKGVGRRGRKRVVRVGR